jgi:hypothetical protein
VDLVGRVDQRIDGDSGSTRGPGAARPDSHPHAHAHAQDGSRNGAVPGADRVRELEVQVDQLETALRSQRQIGVLVGILAERVGLTVDDAWGLAVRLSQDSNVKVREVARVFCDAFDGRGQPADAELVARLMTALQRQPRAVPEPARSGPVAPSQSDGDGALTAQP